MFIGAGLDAHWPLEAAAGMDPMKIRRERGEELALYGGIDKRTLSTDKKTIEREVYPKILPMMELGGGYILAVDHTIPPDVPLENSLYCLTLKSRIAQELN